jgi:hypothetical protein
MIEDGARWPLYAKGHDADDGDAWQSLTMSLDENDLQKIARLVRAALSDETTPVELAAKWRGGKMEIWPRDVSLGAKELAIDAFFHKIVMVRDRLRVLEQQINTHPKLDDHDRVHLQQYITRCHGSLTTFNALFKDKDEHFSGTGGGDKGE